MYYRKFLLLNHTYYEEETDSQSLGSILYASIDIAVIGKTLNTAISNISSASLLSNQFFLSGLFASSILSSIDGFLCLSKILPLTQNNIGAFSSLLLDSDFNSISVNDIVDYTEIKNISRILSSPLVSITAYDNLINIGYITSDTEISVAGQVQGLSSLSNVGLVRSSTIVGIQSASLLQNTFRVLDVSINNIVNYASISNNSSVLSNTQNNIESLIEQSDESRLRSVYYLISSSDVVAQPAPDFSPSSVGGLIGWFDASRHVYLDPSSSGQSANNQPVGMWLNLAVNNYNLLQSTFAKKPVLFDNGGGYKGRPYVAFDGTDDGMSFSNTLALTGDFSMWFVRSLTDGPSVANNNLLYYSSGENTEISQNTSQLFFKSTLNSGQMLNIISNSGFFYDYIERNNNVITYKPSGISGYSSSINMSGNIYFNTLFNKINNGFYRGGVGEIFLYNQRNTIQDQIDIEQYINRPILLGPASGWFSFGTRLFVFPDTLYSERPRSVFTLYIKRLLSIID